ncbi:MAG: hypothetical protein L3K13_08780 [Thermoplasmata archaeon]|nr:hypothetical protein [Thermoplasmata archaeon]
MKDTKHGITGVRTLEPLRDPEDLDRLPKDNALDRAEKYLLPLLQAAGVSHPDATLRPCPIWYEAEKDKLRKGSKDWLAADAFAVLELIRKEVALGAAQAAANDGVLLGQLLEHLQVKEKHEPSLLPAIRGRKRGSQGNKNRAALTRKLEHKAAADIWRKHPGLTKKAVADRVAGHIAQTGKNPRTPERIARELPSRDALLAAIKKT